MKTDSMNEKKLELYIHIPFCVKKCDYCDFLSFPADSNTQIRYVHALLPVSYTHLRQELARELLSPQLNGLFVTPKNIDDSIKNLSFLISEGLNIALLGDKEE